MSKFIIKRSGERVGFDTIKIYNAIKKANDAETLPDKKLSNEEVVDLALHITNTVVNKDRDMSVEEIQDLVETELCSCNKDIFLRYHDYR